MNRRKNGYITLYLTLILGVMISLVFVLLEGIRNKTIRTETESVMDIGLYSVFGEYHRQLLEQYDLFFIDTSYGEGRPDIKRSEEHLQYYMNENFRKDGIQNLIGFRDLTDLNCDNVEFENYILASDDQGKILKAQIVDYMQDKKGIDIAEDLLNQFEIIQSGNYMSRLMVQQGIITNEQSMFIEKVPEALDKVTYKRLIIVDDCVSYSNIRA